MASANFTTWLSFWILDPVTPLVQEDIVRNVHLLLPKTHNSYYIWRDWYWGNACLLGNMVLVKMWCNVSFSKYESFEARWMPTGKIIPQFLFSYFLSLSFSLPLECKILMYFVPFVTIGEPTMSMYSHKKHYMSYCPSIPGNPNIPYSPEWLLFTICLSVVCQKNVWEH